MTQDTTANRAGTVDYASIDISVADAKPVERPFLGTITIDQYEDGRVFDDSFSGINWHLGVTRVGAEKPFHTTSPLKYAKEDSNFLNGEDGRETRYSMQGQFGRVLNSIREVFGTKDDEGNARKPGHGSLEGLTGWFVMRVLEYGKDRATGEVRTGGRASLIAVKKATKDEIESAGAGATPGAAAKSLSADDIEAALDILDGRKPLEYQKLVMKADLSAELKSGILSGDVAKALVAAGHAVQDGNVIRRVEAVVEVAA